MGALVIWILGATIGLHVYALENGLARTPPMGFNTWNPYGCELNETVVRAVADELNSTGMTATWRYLVVDDCWANATRDAQGLLVADPVSFPSGIRALSDYVHSRGLLFGLYTDAGVRTCANRPGSYGREAADMAQFAAWGVDYVKIDWCFVPAGADPYVRFGLFRDAIAATDRPMVISACVWGYSSPALWAQEYSHLWRTTTDIHRSMANVLANLDRNDRWAQYAGPGGWNDPDMLVAGLDGLSSTQSISHVALWAVIKSPLMLGMPAERIGPRHDPALFATLSNPDLIGINQDPSGVQARRVASSFDLRHQSSITSIVATFHP
jgi:alpha-galactosidase